MTNHSLSYWLKFSLSDLAYQVSINQILEHYSDLEQFIKDNIKSFNAAELNSPLVEASYHWAEVDNQHIITYNDPLYPPLLKTITHPPPLLYVKGDPATLSLNQIAVVGSRYPSHSGRSITAALTADLVASGFCITSGLAAGIDISSHLAALNAGGKTIAVLGNGLHSIYPKKHTAVAEAIAQQGCVISEFPLDTPPSRKNFPQRNRIISGLSLGTLVVEAKIRSGSLITARYAVEQGREVFAVPGSIRHSLSQGCHQLIRDGAALVETANDIFDSLNITSTASRHQKNATKQLMGLDRQQQQLLACVDYEGTTIDVVIERSRVSAITAARLLLNLELHGYINSTQRGYVRVK